MRPGPRPGGVDIQIVKAWRPGLPRRVCSAAELAWLDAQPQLWPAFTLLWTLKEAQAKESGRGLTTSIRDIRVPSRDRAHWKWTGSASGPGPAPAGRRQCADTASRRKKF